MKRFLLMAALFHTAATAMLASCPSRLSLPCPLSSHCLLVDGSLSAREAAAQSFVYTSFQEAVRHLQPGVSDAERTTVLIRPGVYWIDDPDDPAIRQPENGDGVPVGLHIRCPWLRIVGLGERPDDVVLACNRGQTQGANGNFTMLAFHGDGLLLENLTLGNYCNVDLVYPLDSTQNCPRRMEAITQAQLAFADGDFLEARRCRFISRLNTCPLNGGRRTLFDHCYFESTDDALEGRAVYRHCRFTFFSPKPFYATSRAGAILYDCDFHVKTAGTQYLTKQESPVVLIDCRFHTPPATSLGWCKYISPRLRCYQANVTQNGIPVTLSADTHGTTVHLEGKNLSDALKTVLDEPLPTMFRKLESLPIHAELHADRLRVEQGDTARTTRCLYAFGDRLVGEEPSRMFVGNNETDTAVQEILTATTADGLQAAIAIENAPLTLPPPTFTKHPRIRRKGNTFQADYQLDLGGRRDESLVTWWRCDDRKGGGAVPVSVSRMGIPEQTYILQPGDEGHYLMATVEPRHLRSSTGPAVRILSRKPVARAASPVPFASRLETDFRHFPTTPQPLIREGYWTVDGFKPEDTAAYPWEPDPDSWFYGQGIDGATGTGLLQKAKGARLLYTPTSEQKGGMRIRLLVDPSKTAAQGFGSATGQYLDLFIHYDTHTRSGYGLRIVRTTKHANAVDMLLMAYDHGLSRPLSPPVSTTCFLTHCTIELWSEGSQLKAHASTTSPQRESPLAKEVRLEAPITPAHYGLGLQHTGSTGSSAIMLHQLEVEWDQDAP